MSYLSMLVSLPDPDYQADIDVLKYLNIHRLEWWLILRAFRNDPELRIKADPKAIPFRYADYDSRKLAYRKLRDKLMFKTKTQYERINK